MARSLSGPAGLSCDVLGFVLGAFSFRSDWCRATVSREHGTEFSASHLLKSPGCWVGRGRRLMACLQSRDEVRGCLPSSWPVSDVGSLVTKKQKPI